ncbi:MAG: AAA domain-containing protein [Phycisphaera sp.]|nr:AAA domain-containing protein [Phycisphaera sp.]
MSRSNTILPAGESHATTRDDRALLAEASRACSALREAMAPQIVGQQTTIRVLTAALLAEGHALLIGVPGLAKTTLVKAMAQALDWSFGRVQFTPDTMPTDVVGMELLQDDPQTGKRTTRFVPGPIFANLVLADEVNRTPPRTQSALLEAMQERQATSFGVSHALPNPFVVFATQNPIEQEGTYPLPEAQLDRFMVSLHLDYPDMDEEKEIVRRSNQSLHTDADRPAEPVVDAARFVRFTELVRGLPVSEHVTDHVVALVRATRPTKSVGQAISQDGGVADRMIRWGAGPRAAQHLARVARALAVIDGQPTPSIAHVREAAPWVLRHRLVMNHHAEAEGYTADDALRDVLAQVHEQDYTHRPHPTGR